jgi:hypothetical protein
MAPCYLRTAYTLKSRMTGNCHVRFGSGGRGREAPAHHDLAAPSAKVLRPYTPVDSSNSCNGQMISIISPL